MLDGLHIIPLKKISNPKGDIFHAMKNIDLGYVGFGEAYFSEIISGEIKGWKRHMEMVLNLVVILGKVRFVMYDDRPDSSTYGQFYQTILSVENYNRLTVPVGVWLAFEGVSESRNLLLNLASIPHNPDESEVRHLDDIKFGW